MNPNYLQLVIAVTVSLVIATFVQAKVHVQPFLQDAEPNSVWVVWETTGKAPSVVRYGRNDVLAGEATGYSFQSNGENRIHQVYINNLLPNTEYIYYVDGAEVNPVTFRTPPVRTSEKSFRFVAYSDTQGGPIPDMHTQVVNEGIIDFTRENYGENLAEQLAFSIQPGDLVDRGSRYLEWKEQYFDEQKNLIRHIPVYPVAGNHEQDAHWYFDYFKLPENGTAGYIEHWWYKDYSNVRIIGLDSNSKYRIEKQLEWLDRTLEDAAQDDLIDFVFVQLHHPHLSGIWTPGNTPYTGEVVNRMEEFSRKTGKPSVHFFGHTHAYERGQSRDANHTWINVAAGEGGIDYWGITPPEDYPEFQKVFPDWGFVFVDVVAGSNPSFRVRRVSRGNEIDPMDNEVLDDFTIRRYNDSPQTPMPLSPVASAMNLDAEGGFYLQASSYKDQNNDHHLESHFQLTTTQADYTNAAEDVWVRFENWYAPEGASGKANGWYSVNTVKDPNITRAQMPRLDANTTYFWRVRYRDAGLVWSDWSVESSFTTGDAVFGACCASDGTCTFVRQYECLEPNTWHARVSCENAPCPDVAVVWSEDFESAELRKAVDEWDGDVKVWTAQAPEGWVIDRTKMPAGGVTEWRGWNLARKTFWIEASGDQGRSQFVRGSGIVAVADPDEWDDAERSRGLFHSVISTPEIKIDNLKRGSTSVIFDSSWMPSGQQTAKLTAQYDNGKRETLFTWASSGEHAKRGAISEEVVFDLQEQPGNAKRVKLFFELSNAGNDWFWAIDNIRVVGELD